MMTDVVIRQASYEDLDTLLQLRMEVLHNSGQLNYGDSEELEEASWHYYQSALTDGSHIACIATANGSVLGCEVCASTPRCPLRQIPRASAHA